MLHCVVCEGEITRRKTGPIPRYCSASCRARACDARAREDGRGERWTAAKNARRRAPRVEMRCPFCRETFLTARPDNQKTCGADVCRAANHAARTLPHVMFRDAVKRGADAERFDPREVFERDGWRCGICERPVDPDLRHPAPLSASLDHVVPLSRGGSHTRANTRCSHLVCNSSRGARGGGEQLLLVG